MDLLIFSGQSNMQGQSEALINVGVSDCFEYKFLTDSLVPLADPVGEPIKRDGSAGWPLHPSIPLRDELSPWLNEHAMGGTAYGCTSLVPAFCSGFGRPCVAVHCAKGSTQIHEWLPGTDSYSVLIKKCRAAIAKVRPKRIYFVWLQGESDALASRTEQYYKDALTELKNALKADLGIDKFGIITVGRFTASSCDDEIINAQRSVCRDDADFVCLFDALPDISQNADNMNPKVAGHYSAKTLIDVGTAAGKSAKECFK